VSFQTIPPEQESPTNAALPPEEIREAGISGVRWGGLARLVTELVSLGAMVGLARLLAPSEFGEAVIGFAAMEFAGVISYQSVAVPLIQRHEATRAHLEVGALIALIEGVLIGALVFLVGAPLAGDALGGEAASLVELASLAFVLNGALAVPQALLERRLEFRRLASISIVGAFCAPAVSVALAAAGMGSAALLIGPLAALAVGVGLTWASAPPPSPRWRRSAQRDLMTFGAPALGSGLLHVGWQNVDYAVVAARLDAATLGLYWRAYTFGVQYRRKLTAVVASLALPLYARSGRATQLALRLRLIRLQSLIAFPLLGAMILLAPSLIPFALGDVWERAVVPTQILAVAGMAAVVQAGTGPLVLALGRPGAMLIWNLGNVIGLGIVTYLFAPLGLVPLSCAVTGFFVIRVAIGQEVMLRRIAGTAPGELWRSCLPALAATAGMLAAGGSLLAGLAALGVPDGVAAAIAAAAGSGAYLAILRFGFAPVLAELLSVLVRVLPRRRPRVEEPPRETDEEVAGSRP
jgi:O-antigen/teichoic acid export membrane protein